MTTTYPTPDGDDAKTKDTIRTFYVSEILKTLPWWKKTVDDQNDSDRVYEISGGEGKDMNDWFWVHLRTKTGK